MNALRPVLVVAALLALSCSSKEKPATSGGAYFQLQSAGGTGGACLDTGKDFFISIKDSEGNHKLITDGADGASVRCNVDSGRFDVVVSNSNGTTLTASGTIKGTESTDTSMTLVTSGNTYLTRGADKCTVTIVTNADGKFRGNFVCNRVEHKTLPNACAVSANGANPSYFSFSNCNPF